MYLNKPVWNWPTQKRSYHASLRSTSASCSCTDLIQRKVLCAVLVRLMHEGLPEDDTLTVVFRAVKTDVCFRAVPLFPGTLQQCSPLVCLDCHARLNVRLYQASDHHPHCGWRAWLFLHQKIIVVQPACCCPCSFVFDYGQACKARKYDSFFVGLLPPPPEQWKVYRKPLCKPTIQLHHV